MLSPARFTPLFALPLVLLFAFAPKPATPPVTTESYVLSGRVTNFHTGKPLADVTIRAKDGSSTSTDEGGYYQIRLTTSQTELTFRRGGYYAGMYAVDVTGVRGVCARLSPKTAAVIEDCQVTLPDHFEEDAIFGTTAHQLFLDKETASTTLILMDGKPISYAQLQKLDSDRIREISVYKDPDYAAALGFGREWLATVVVSMK